MMVKMKLGSYFVCALSSEQTVMQYSFRSLLSNLGTNYTEMHRMLSSWNKIHWYDPHNTLAMSQTSQIICLQSSSKASCTFVTLSAMVPVAGCPKCLLSLTYMYPFWKHSNDSLVWVRPKALSPNASLSILCVSTAVLPSLKQIWCEFVVLSHQLLLISWYNHKTVLLAH